MQQMPPPFSAKKVAGTPAYKLAREQAGGTQAGKSLHRELSNRLHRRPRRHLRHEHHRRRLRTRSGARNGHRPWLRSALEARCAAPRQACSTLPRERIHSLIWSRWPATCPRSRSFACIPARFCPRCPPSQPTLTRSAACPNGAQGQPPRVLTGIARQSLRRSARSRWHCQARSRHALSTSRCDGLSAFLAQRVTPSPFSVNFFVTNVIFKIDRA